jgi:fumarate reductase subunit C
MSEVKTNLYPQSVKGGGKGSQAYSKSMRVLRAEVISGGTGLLLASFIMGHLVLESSILMGKETYEIVAEFMEKTLPIAQVSIFVVTIAFFFHFVYASRKIPARLAERRMMMELGLSIKKASGRWNQPNNDIKQKRHRETSLWLWQVRTGMTVLALGAFHLFLVMWNLFTDMGFADAHGFTAQISTSRVESGLWILYILLGFTVVTHMAIGLYRLAVKWISDTRLNRKTAYIICLILFTVYLILNIAAVLGLAGKFSLI